MQVPPYLAFSYSYKNTDAIMGPHDSSKVNSSQRTHLQMAPNWRLELPHSSLEGHKLALRSNEWSRAETFPLGNRMLQMAKSRQGRAGCSQKPFFILLDATIHGHSRYSRKIENSETCMNFLGFLLCRFLIYKRKCSDVPKSYP
jgi:hypothetical protein